MDSNGAFEIENGRLKKYHGNDSSVIIPDGVTEIGLGAFRNCTDLRSVVIPDSVTVIGNGAFGNCANLVEINIPDSVKEIEISAFEDCTALTEISIPDSVTKIWRMAFRNCTGLADGNGFVVIRGTLYSYHGNDSSIRIPDSVTEISSHAFFGCAGLTEISIPDSVTKIGSSAFENCVKLTSLALPDSISEIEMRAFFQCFSLVSINIPDGVPLIEGSTFQDCRNLSSITIPDSVTQIDYDAFSGCTSLTSAVISNNVKKIGSNAFRSCKELCSVNIPRNLTSIEKETFWGCSSLTSLIIPDKVEKIGFRAFYGCTGLTIICQEGSFVHHYCVENNISYVFDYQFEAFNGLLPQGVEMLASPFLADEEKPFVFISYSHKDRDTVLEIIKGLYEAGWKIWYDEGLTIGDKYDVTLEDHVKNCSAFLLFVTHNSLNSYYCRENEIPWAIQYGKPIIKCELEKGLDFEIENSAVAATVSQSGIESAFEKINGLTKGERREAKGIQVVVNPADRDGADGDGFAYCMYTEKNAATAKAIMLEAKKSGCTLYDAVEEGTDEERLENCACLIVFLDQAFLSNAALMKTLIDAYQSGRDMAVCQLESIGNDDLPPELLGLHKMQWLHFGHGITGDMTTKLSRHLQKRGCRNSAVLPGFEYEKNDSGIVIKRYTGMQTELRIESEYGSIPVVEIADKAFENCVHLHSIVIPDSVISIGESAFRGCSSLSSVKMPDYLSKIKNETFQDCSSLSSITIPNSVTEIGKSSFKGCASLESVQIPKNVKNIDMCCFFGCKSLKSVTLPDGVPAVAPEVFRECSNLTAVIIPDSVTRIGRAAFSNCIHLNSIVLPEGLTEIGGDAFYNCSSLTYINIPDRVRKIDDSAFARCTNLDATASRLPKNVVEYKAKVFDGRTLRYYPGPYYSDSNNSSDHNSKNAPAVSSDPQPIETPHPPKEKESRPGFFSRLFGKK